MTWSDIQIGGKSAELYVPPRSGPRAGMVLFLHGYDGTTLKNNEYFTREFERHNLIAVAPLGSHCWWSDAVYPPFDPAISPVEFLSQQILEYAKNNWNLEPPKIAVTGIEMGGQGALQLAYRYARKFPIVAAISPKVDFETWWGHGTSLDEIFPNQEAARQRTATLHIHPLDYPKHQLLLCDPADVYCFDGVLTLASKLSSSGIPFDRDLETSHGGFGWGYANAMAKRSIDFIAENLQST